MRLSFETFGAIGAIVVSIAALFVAYDQAVVMRQQQHAAVWPIMSLDVSINQDDSSNMVGISTSNAGVGPAIVYSAIPTVDGEPIATWGQLSELLFEEETGVPFRIGTSSVVGVVAVGEDVEALAISWDRSEEGDALLLSLVERMVGGTLGQLSMEICYCSVFDRCWVAGLMDQTYPDQVNSCEASADFLETFFSEEDLSMGAGE